MQDTGFQADWSVLFDIYGELPGEGSLARLHHAVGADDSTHRRAFTWLFVSLLLSILTASHISAAPGAFRAERMGEKSEVIDGYTINYPANGTTRWSKGRIENGNPIGYREWDRVDETLERSSSFEAGEPAREWPTDDRHGEACTVTCRGRRQLKA